MTDIDTGLGCDRREGETWREAAERQAKDVGLQIEVLEAYDQHLANGHAPSRACWMALCDWDCLSFVKAPTGESKRRFRPGDRVVTADRLTGSAAYLPAHGRVRNMPGMIVRQRESPVPRFDVRHDKDGVIAPYDADELTEEKPHE